MIFDYTVKHNGVRYPAGTDVPVGGDAPQVETKEEVKEEPKVEADVEQKPKAKPIRKTSKKK